MVDGTEIRLFDPDRNPRNWTDLLLPTDCAVLLRHRVNSGSLSSDGHPVLDPVQATCIIFGSLDAAERYSEAKVQLAPHVRCEVYDAEGLAHPALLVILHPDHRPKDDLSPQWARRRLLLIFALLLCAGLLLWIGIRDSSDLVIFLAINCIFLALRFVYWNFGVKQRERDRLRRLEEHRRKEKAMPTCT
jgi:hypothetical protein